MKKPFIPPFLPPEIEYSSIFAHTVKASASLLNIHIESTARL